MHNLYLNTGYFMHCPSNTSTAVFEQHESQWNWREKEYADPHKMIINERLEKLVDRVDIALRVNISRAGQTFERLQ